MFDSNSEYEWGNDNQCVVPYRRAGRRFENRIISRSFVDLPNRGLLHMN